MKVELGEVTGQFDRDLKNTIEDVISRFSHKRNPYYMLVYAEEGLDVYPVDVPSELQPGDKVLRIDNKRVIRTKILVIDMEPQFDEFMDLALKGKMRVLGMMCYRADNIKGQLVRLWVLPQDIPVPETILDEDRVVKEVLDNSQIIGKYLR